MTRQLTERFALAVLASAMVVVMFCWVVPSVEAATPTCTKVYKASSGSGANTLLLVPVSSQNSYSCVLGQGNANSAVDALQGALNYCYGAGLSRDGNFGSRTKSALRSAQSREGISADGVYGPVTSTHLMFESINEVTDAAACGGRRR